MSKTAWTPGPWAIGEDNFFAYYSLIQIEVNDGDLTICDVLATVEPFEEISDRDRANARLIAAAPELYEALENLTNTILINDEEGLAQHAEAMTAANAALAKARGE